MPTILRPSRAAFRFSGPEAQKLLFDVVTGRLLAEAGPAVWWALLSPQGKVQAEGLSGWAEDAFWLDVDATVADAFLKKMKLYRLRAQVQIDDLRETHSVGWSFDGWTDGIVHADPRGLGERVIAENTATAGWLPPDDRFAAHRISAGIPEQGPDFGIDQNFAHDIGLDLLDGIDFVKGCYIGQEVVSRMKHRGTARRRPVIVSGIEAPAGTPVVAGGRDAGPIGEVIAGRAVAIIRLDRITDPAAVTVGGKPVTLELPGYANYQFGEASADDASNSRISAVPTTFLGFGDPGVTVARGKERAWQRMLSGRRLDILDPSPLDVELSDIAHGLARVARWNGQTLGDYPFSVAQHSVLVLELYRALNRDADPRALLYAVLHDAPEYVMGDIISPFKAAMGGNYKEVENRLLGAVYLRFSLPATPPAALQKQIKRADREAAFLEATHLAGFDAEEARRYFGEPSFPVFEFEPFEKLIRPWPTREAYDRFVEVVEKLAAELP